MIYASLAVLALSASVATSPLSLAVPMHSHTKVEDGRISLTLLNQSMMNRDVTVGGQTYSMDARTTLTIKAPAGTKVYSGSITPQYKVGQVVLEVAPALNGRTVVLD